MEAQRRMIDALRKSTFLLSHRYIKSENKFPHSKGTFSFIDVPGCSGYRALSCGNILNFVV